MKESVRQLSVSELGRDQLSSELETLRLQLRDGQHWQAEKQVHHVHKVHIFVQISYNLYLFSHCCMFEVSTNCTNEKYICVSLSLFICLPMSVSVCVCVFILM